MNMNLIKGVCGGALCFVAGLLVPTAIDKVRKIVKETETKVQDINDEFQTLTQEEICETELGQEAIDLGINMLKDVVLEYAPCTIALGVGMTLLGRTDVELTYSTLFSGLLGTVIGGFTTGYILDRCFSKPEVVEEATFVEEEPIETEREPKPTRKIYTPEEYDEKKKELNEYLNSIGYHINADHYPEDDVEFDEYGREIVMADEDEDDFQVLAEQGFICDYTIPVIHEEPYRIPYEEWSANPVYNPVEWIAYPDGFVLDSEGRYMPSEDVELFAGTQWWKWMRDTNLNQIYVRNDKLKLDIDIYMEEENFVDCATPELLFEAGLL